MTARGFTRFPETTGFAAIGDLMTYVNSPMPYGASTSRSASGSPRTHRSTWPRTSGTFGENTDLTGRLGAAYVKGLQDEAGP